MEGRTASEKISAFVRSIDSAELPPEMSHRAARAFVDTFASAVAGRLEAAPRIARDYVLAEGSDGPSTLWTTGERVRAEDAALVNGVAGHVMDYDDVTSPQRGHPSAVLFPALVALGETVDATGGQVGAAYIAGFEVIVKFAKAMAFDHYAKGWHSTSTLGVLGATAGGSQLLGLSSEQTVAALGIAASNVAGSRRSFGTMTKSLQPGQAAAAAVRAVKLAAVGFTAPVDAFDGMFGFMDLYGNGENLHLQLDALGEAPMELVRTGIEVKKYPLCYATHRPLQGLRDLMAQQPFRSADVERIRVTVQPQGLVPLIHHRPWRGLEGKFSMEYAMAAMLLDGAVRLGSFTDAAVQRPEIQAFLRRVEAHEEEGDPWPRRALVEVDLQNGERRSLWVKSLEGSAQMPLSEAELEAKLRDCVSFSRAEMDVNGFLSSAWSWEDRPIRSLLEYLPRG